MNILGIGPLELFFIVLIMLVVLGPKETINTAHRTARMIRKTIRSPGWKTIMKTVQDIRETPVRILKESELQENIDQLRNETGRVLDPALESIRSAGEDLASDPIFLSRVK